MELHDIQHHCPKSVDEDISELRHPWLGLKALTIYLARRERPRPLPLVTWIPSRTLLLQPCGAEPNLLTSHPLTRRPLALTARLTPSGAVYHPSSTPLSSTLVPPPPITSHPIVLDIHNKPPPWLFQPFPYLSKIFPPPFSPVATLSSSSSLPFQGNGPSALSTPLSLSSSLLTNKLTHLDAPS